MKPADACPAHRGKKGPLCWKARGHDGNHQNLALAFHPEGNYLSAEKKKERSEWDESRAYYAT
jgi:hypothetical protein